MGKRDARLALLDQAAFLSQRATGRAQLTQLVWVYERGLDRAGIKSFHQNFGYGLAGRRIERSALPFGRHRWVSSVGPAVDADHDERPRPRAALSDWIDERAQIPVDPETGPGWHLATLAMTDGSAAVTLVGSHCLFDGVGFLQTIAEAVDGTTQRLDYPPPAARSLSRAVTEDLLQSARDAGSVGRALLAGAKFARSSPRGGASEKRRVGTDSGGTDTVVVPAISAFVDLEPWDSAAARLGGNSQTLLAAFSTALAARMQRVHPDSGTVALLIAVSDRVPGDTRANALRFARVDLDPVEVITDLAGARGAIRAALADVRERPDDSFALLPLTPLIPKRAVRTMGNAVFGDQPVSSSNLGDLDPAVARIDGTVADYVFLRPVDQNVRRSEIEAGGGTLVVAAGRIAGRMSIGIVGYQAAAVNTKERLRVLAADTLDELGLTGVLV